MKKRYAVMTITLGGDTKFLAPGPAGIALFADEAHAVEVATKWEIYIFAVVPVYVTEAIAKARTYER